VRHLRAGIPAEQQHVAASAQSFLFLLNDEASALITHVISYVSALRVRHLWAEIPAEQQHDAASTHSAVMLLLL
jgi:hypothetical protein